jgi:hypothetical protein
MYFNLFLSSSRVNIASDWLNFTQARLLKKVVNSQSVFIVELWQTVLSV